MSLRAGIAGLPRVGKSTLFTSVPSMKLWSPLNNASFPPAFWLITNGNRSICAKQIGRSHVSALNSSSAVSVPGLPVDSPLLGLEDVMLGYLLGKTKATEVAHLVWKKIVQKGDTVVDATCGNGHDTLALAKLVSSDKTLRGRVYSLDVQKVALEKTSALLDESLDRDEREFVKLVETCHSKMHEVVPKGEPVRVVAFNLGYLPGGDKALITSPQTTLLALEYAKDLIKVGGLISIVGYVGHPGGREEFETVQEFGSRLPVDEWGCCVLRMLNRPLAPVLVFMFKR